MPPTRIAVVLALLLITLISRLNAHPRAEEDDVSHEGEEDIDMSLEAELQAEMVSEAPNRTETIETTDLLHLAEDNSSALKRLAEVMGHLIQETSSERCLGTGGNTQHLTDSIKEGFSILVGAVQDLNNTLRHFKEEINQKVFSNSEATAFEDDGPCPSPFFMAGEDCIYIEIEHLRFFDAARQACIDMGAKLAEFSNFDAFINAVDAMDIYDAEIYVGATDEDSEGEWRWLSGNRVGYIRWGDGEPSNSHGREHCLAMFARNQRFNDIPCSFRRGYACVKK